MGYESASNFLVYSKRDSFAEELPLIKYTGCSRPIDKRHQTAAFVCLQQRREDEEHDKVQHEK